MSLKAEEIIAQLADHCREDPAQVDITKWSLMQSTDDKRELDTEYVKDRVELIARQLNQLDLAAYYETQGFTVAYEGRLNLLIKVIERYPKALLALCQKRIRPNNSCDE